MDLLFHAAELIGTVAFAISGALMAIRKQLDLFGIIFLGVVTALGGGTIRDLLLGITPPRMFSSSEYVLLAVATALVVFLLAKFSPHRDYQGPNSFMNFIYILSDALGLGIFAVIGTQAGIQAGRGSNAFLCIFLGMTTGVGGGILRDMMCGDIPSVLRRHIYAVAAICGSGLFYLLNYLSVDSATASLAGMAFTVVIRLLSWHQRWHLPRVQSRNDQDTGNEDDDE